MSSTASPYAHALADFGLNTYREINAAAKDKCSNIFLSPLSISFALAMTYAGAGGNTRIQLRNVLLGDHTKAKDDELHQLFSQVMKLANQEGNAYKLNLANRLYAHAPNVSELLDTFTNLLKSKYASDMQTVDFAKNVETSQLINQWVSDKTNQKIKDLVPADALSESTQLVLVNAIYFKGDWKTKFDAQNTRKEKFQVAENKDVDVDMMDIRNTKFNYNENEGFQLLGLPYVGEHLYMYIFLPKNRFGLAELEKSLISRNFLEAIEQAQGKENFNVVNIPKFKLEETAKLVPILKNLGAGDMFDHAADFSNINGQRNLYVSEVIHKAFIEVNEEGTEAAAATAAVVNYRCAMPDFTFIADHPFMFTIIDQRTMSILFLGRYCGPK